MAKAREQLEASGALVAGGKITIVEIGKHTSAPVRLFSRNWGRGGKEFTGNPRIGTWFSINNEEGWLATTGWPFLNNGTANPLHVRRIGKGMLIDHIAADLFALSSLAWTQPATCSRYPVTLRLNDILLRREAGEFDADSIEFASYYEEGAA